MQNKPSGALKLSGSVDGEVCSVDGEVCSVDGEVCSVDVEVCSWMEVLPCTSERPPLDGLQNLGITCKKG